MFPTLVQKVWVQLFIRLRCFACFYLYVWFSTASWAASVAYSWWEYCLESRVPWVREFESYPKLPIFLLLKWQFKVWVVLCCFAYLLWCLAFLSISLIELPWLLFSHCRQLTYSFWFLWMWYFYWTTNWTASCEGYISRENAWGW